MSRKKRKRPRKPAGKRRRKRPRRLHPWTPVPRLTALLRSPSQLADHLAADLDRQGEGESEGEDPGLKRRRRLLTKAERDPSSVLDDPRCLSPGFLVPFLDLCDGKALERPEAAPAYARAALELAKKTGESHWRNLARGVAVHARIATSRWKAAGGLLDEYRASAFGCCRVCAGDWLRRQGDLLAESEDPARARMFLEMSAHVLGGDLDDDARGRILFVRGIAWFFLGDRDHALEDAGAALALLSLESSRSYFPDAVAFLAVFLKRGPERRHVEAAMESLERFRERLRGQPETWSDVRARLRWVEGQLHFLLGHQQRARRRLDSALGAMRRDGAPHRWVLAATADLALVYTRHLHDGNQRTIGNMIRRCRQELELDEGLSRLVDQALKALEVTPEDAYRVLSGLRNAFTAPVPGLLAEGA